MVVSVCFEGCGAAEWKRETHYYSTHQLCAILLYNAVWANRMMVVKRANGCTY